MSYLCRFPVFLMAAFLVLAVPSHAQTQAQQAQDEYYKEMMERAKERMKQMESGHMDHGMAMGTGMQMQSAGDHYGDGHDRIIESEIIKTQPMEKGQGNEVTIRLTYEDDGSPVPIQNLQVIHTKPLHLLIVEPQLNDYHHIHPQPTEIAGEYKFTITPETDCHYRAWADLFPVDGPEQSTWADIKGARACDEKPIEESMNMTASHNGYQYAISMDTEELAYDQDTLLYVDVMDQDGKAVTDLQPVMGAFAHLVGFFKDYETIAHIHPMGGEITNMDERGGPTLKFHLKPEKAGYIRFYLQLLIDDEMQYVPFGMVVAEEGPYSGQDRMAEIMALGGEMDHGSMMGMEDMDHGSHPPMPMQDGHNAGNTGLNEAQKAKFKELLQGSDVNIPESMRGMLE